MGNGEENQPQPVKVSLAKPGHKSAGSAVGLPKMFGAVRRPEKANEE